MTSTRVVRSQRRVRRATARAVPRQPGGGRPGVAGGFREGRRHRGRAGFGARPRGRAVRERRCDGRAVRRGTGHPASCRRDDRRAAEARERRSSAGSGRRADRRRRRRDVAGEGVPDARSSERAAGPARVGADGRPGARRDASRAAADAGAAESHPRQTPSSLRSRQHAARGAAAPEGCLHGHDRVRDRAHLGSRRARLASAGDRVRSLQDDARRRRTARAPRAPGSSRGVRDLPTPRIHRSEAVLDRRARRARADARRSGRARRPKRRARGADRDRAPWTAQRAHARRGQVVHVDPPRVRGRALHRRSDLRPRGWDRRRQVPPRGIRVARHRGGGDRGHGRVEPEPPRGGRPGRRGPRARRADGSLVRRRDPRPHRRAARPRSTAMRRSRVRAWSRRRSTCTRSTATRPAAPSTSSPTTRSGSRRIPPRAGRRDTRATSRRDSTSRSSSQRRRSRGRDLGDQARAGVPEEFGHDVVVDLVGYRRFGHNEQDEAAYTQPLQASASIFNAPCARRTPNDSSRTESWRPTRRAHARGDARGAQERSRRPAVEFRLDRSAAGAAHAVGHGSSRADGRRSGQARPARRGAARRPGGASR